MTSTGGSKPLGSVDRRMTNSGEARAPRPGIRESAITALVSPDSKAAIGEPACAACGSSAKERSERRSIGPSSTSGKAPSTPSSSAPGASSVCVGREPGVLAEAGVGTTDCSWAGSDGSSIPRNINFAQINVAPSDVPGDLDLDLAQRLIHLLHQIGYRRAGNHQIARLVQGGYAAPPAR